MASASQDLLRPLRRSEYDQLIALGAFENERLELLDGALVRMAPIKPPHASTVQRLGELLIPLLLGRASVRIQNPYAAGPLSEPEPDVAVVPLGSYDTEHPDHAYLIIEVAESSLAQDCGQKARIYAENGVEEYWVVNLAKRRLEIFRDPQDGRYQRTLASEDPDASVQIRHFPELTLRLGAIIR